MANLKAGEIMSSQEHFSESLSTRNHDLQHQQISRMWEIFEVNSDEILELRAIWPKTPTPTKRGLTKHFRRRDYRSSVDCCAAFQSAALSLNQQGYNIYIIMNKIRPDFCGYAAGDSDIELRRLLLLDIDRAKETKNPANDEELNASREIATKIHNFTDEIEWPKPHVVMSGNGYHLYYRMADFAPNKTTDDLIRKTLSNLSTVFSTTYVKVDTTVSNLSRITKVPGTIARKGTESPGRPYREARVL